MDKITAPFVTVWSLACEGYHTVCDWIERHPQITFWIVVSYLLVRR